MLICLRPPPLLVFCLGWCSNFVGSVSGHIQSVKILQNMVSNRTPNLPPLHTVNVYTVYLFTQGRGGPEIRLEGQHYLQNWVEDNNMTDCTYLQSINSDKHLPQSPFEGKFF
jgi:hypothetical protein